MGSIEKSGCISVAGIAEAKDALAALDLDIQKRILRGSLRDAGTVVKGFRCPRGTQAARPALCSPTPG